MKTPELVIGRDKIIKNTEELFYCSKINEMIRFLAKDRGKKIEKPGFYTTTYIFEDNDMKCVFIDSNYGNDNYQFEISPELWDDLPDKINPMVIYGFGYNAVYQCYEGGDAIKLAHHVPGTWATELNNKVRQLIENET